MQITRPYPPIMRLTREAFKQLKPSYVIERFRFFNGIEEYVTVKSFDSLPEALEAYPECYKNLNSELSDIDVSYRIRCVIDVIVAFN